MKTVNSMLLAVGLSLVAAGCGGNEAEDSEVRDLQKSFKEADSETQSRIQNARRALKEDRPMEVVHNLSAVARQRSLNEQERDAVNNALGRITQEMDRNPEMGSKELYDAVNKLLFEINGEN